MNLVFILEAGRTRTRDLQVEDDSYRTQIHVYMVGRSAERTHMFILLLKMSNVKESSHSFSFVGRIIKYKHS
jgi:ribosomal protein L35AE/L33A